MQWKLVLAGEGSNELGIRIRVGSTKLMIEVNYGKDNAEFTAEFQQKPQQTDGISAPGNGHTDAVSGLEQALLPDVLQKLASKIVHENIVQPA
jgi:hypothetical protein